MKLILCSDWHLVYQNPIGRKDDLTKVQFDKLAFVLKKADELDAPILQAGDFFDKPRSWSLLSHVMDRLKTCGASVYTVYGQHDTYLYSEETRDKTNLGILAKAGLVEIADDKSVYIGGNCYLQGCSFGGEIPKPDMEGLNILIIHAPISDAPAYPGCVYTAAKKFLSLHSGYDLILCGDIHRTFVERIGNMTILNLGPMLRKEATEYNFQHEPKIVIFDTETRELEWVTIPHQPSEEVLSRDHIEIQSEAEGKLQNFIDMMKQDEQLQGVSFQDNLYEFIRTNGIDKEVVDYLSGLMEEK
ncbi:MAG: metallophosphoesterase family protein [Sulfuricurvum sp.]|jgi:DNA repair exonuclease SbcCD nuclease subunit|nr:metallophosphoesterase family protein [Sulfuricurvum sp.]